MVHGYWYNKLLTEINHKDKTNTSFFFLKMYPSSVTTTLRHKVYFQEMVCSVWCRTWGGSKFSNESVANWGRTSECPTLSRSLWRLNETRFNWWSLISSKYMHIFCQTLPWQSKLTRNFHLSFFFFKEKREWKDFTNKPWELRVCYGLFSEMTKYSSFSCKNVFRQKERTGQSWTRAHWLESSNLCALIRSVFWNGTR